MKRICITLYDEAYQKLEHRRQEKGTYSIAQCARELIDLGLKIEEVAQNPDKETPISDELKAINEIKSLLRNDLDWSLEARLLIRFLVENTPPRHPSVNADTLSTYKEKAQDFVNRLFNEQTK